MFVQWVPICCHSWQTHRMPLRHWNTAPAMWHLGLIHHGPNRDLGDITIYGIGFESDVQLSMQCANNCWNFWFHFDHSQSVNPVFAVADSVQAPLTKNWWKVLTSIQRRLSIRKCWWGLPGVTCIRLFFEETGLLSLSLRSNKQFGSFSIILCFFNISNLWTVCSSCSIVRAIWSRFSSQHEHCCEGTTTFTEPKRGDTWRWGSRALK